MKIITKGITRIVILIGNYAIKIPNFTNNQNHFLFGCLSNWNERQMYKQYKKNIPNKCELLCPTLFCSFFGLISIQKRCAENEIHLSKKQCELYQFACGNDNKKENFGYYNGKLVCLDYGFNT